MRLVKQYIEDFPDHGIGSFRCRDLQPITKFLISDKKNSGMYSQL